MAVSISMTISQGTQSVANNTTKVTVKVKATWTAGSWNNWGTAPGWIKIDGETKNFSGITFNESQTTTGSKTIMEWTKTVSHNSYGTKKVSCSASFTSGVSSGTVTCSGSKTLTTIPRKSSISAVSASALEGSSTITVKKLNSSFTHTITYKCGTATGTVCSESSLTSVPWSPPASLAEQNINGTNLTVVFTIKTHDADGNDVSGTNTWTSYAYYIPDNATFKPTASITSVADKFSYRGTYGAYVQGKSQLVIGCSGGAKHGASISSYTTTIDGKSYTGASVTTDVITESGDAIPIKTTAKDSRGLTSDEATWNIDILPYASPTITSLSAKRTGTSSNKIEVTFSGKVSPLNNVNAANYYIQYKKSADADYCDPILITLDTSVDKYNVTNAVYEFDAESSGYDIKLIIEDDFDSDPKQTTGPSASKLWSIFNRDKGFAFGKIAEFANLLDVNWAARIRGKLTVDDEVQVGQNNKFIFGTDTNGSASNLIGINGNNNILIGWDVYNQNIGNSVIYGKQVRFNSNEGIFADGSKVATATNKILWAAETPLWITNASNHNVNLDEAVSAQEKGIVLVWSRYTNSAWENAYFNVKFIPKEYVSRHNKAGVSMIMVGTPRAGHIIGSKYIYVGDTQITGYANNGTNYSGTDSGINITNQAFVLRYVIGV